MVTIDSSMLKEALMQIKDGFILPSKRIKAGRIKDLINARIDTLDTILIWINNAENKGVIDMEPLKIGLGKTVKLSDMHFTRSRLDQAIMEEASHLKETGDARMIDPTAVNFVYFRNRVYLLAKEGKINKDTKPVKQGDQIYLALRPTTRKPQKSKRDGAFV